MRRFFTPALFAALAGFVFGAVRLLLGLWPWAALRWPTTPKSQ